MNTDMRMRDPTSEASEVLRQRTAPPPSLDGKTVALLDIAKERSDEFLDDLEPRLAARGLNVIRYRKASNSKTAAPEIVQSIVTEADVLIEALAD